MRGVIPYASPLVPGFGFWCPLPSFSLSRFSFNLTLLRLLLFLVHGSRLDSVGFELVRAVDCSPFLFFISFSFLFQISSFFSFLLGWFAGTSARHSHLPPP